MCNKELTFQHLYIFFTGSSFPIDTVPSFWWTTCPVLDDWDKCLLIDFQDVWQDDIILLKKFAGTENFLKGRLLRDQNTTVWVEQDETDIDKLKVFMLKG